MGTFQWVGLSSLALICAATVVLLIVRRVRRARRVNRLKEVLGRHPIVPVGRAKSGPLVIQGRARALETLVAPLSGKQVIGYRVRVERIYRGANNAPTYAPQVEETRVADFEVEDSTGNALVRASGSRMVLELESQSKTGLFKRGLPATVDALLDAHGVEREVLIPGEYRWSEWLLEAGETVFAYGHAFPPERGTPHNTVVGSAQGGELFVADLPREDLLRSLTAKSDLAPGVLEAAEGQAAREDGDPD
jgi:hypothetical protein